MENLNTCPICKGEIKYKQLLIKLANYIVKDLKDLQNEMMLNQAVANSSIDEVLDNLKGNDIVAVLENTLNNLEQSETNREKIYMLKGKLDTYTDIMTKLNEWIEK